MNPYIEKFKSLNCYQDVIDAVMVNIPYVEKQKKIKHFPRQVTQAMAMIAEIRRTLKESKEDERELCLLDYDSNNDIFPILAAHLLKFRYVFVVKPNYTYYVRPQVDRLAFMGSWEEHNIGKSIWEKMYRVAYDKSLNPAQEVNGMIPRTFLVSIQPNNSRHQIQLFGLLAKHGLGHWLINLEQYDKGKHGRLPKQEWIGNEFFVTYEKFAYSVLAKAETFTSRSIKDMRLFYDDNIQSRWNAIVRIK